MEEFLRFLEKYEIWFYIISGGLGLIYLRKMLLAWRDLRNAIFGLERDYANRRFVSAMTIVILLAIFTAAEFTLVSFVTPTLPDLKPLATPTIELITTPTAPIIAESGTQIAPLNTELQLTVTAAASSDGCIPGQIEWQSPLSGEEISGSVILEGTVDPPNFGFYKYEFSQPGSETWTTIAAGNEKRLQSELGSWNTSEMPQGDYLLRLVVVDNQNQPYPPCILPVRIIAPQ